MEFDAILKYLNIVEDQISYFFSLFLFKLLQKILFQKFFVNDIYRTEKTILMLFAALDPHLLRKKVDKIF